MTLAFLLPLAVALTAGAGPQSSVLLVQRGPERGRYEIQVIDPATGEAANGRAPFVFNLTGKLTAQKTLSADGLMLAVVEPRGEVCESYGGVERCLGRDHMLHLIDLNTWRPVSVPLSREGRPGIMAFSPDHARLAVALHEEGSDWLVLVATASAEIRARQRIAFHPSLLRFAPDGGRLIAFGQPAAPRPGVTRPGPPRVLLADGHTLDVAWDHELSQVVRGHWCMENCGGQHHEQLHARWMPAVVLARDGRALHIVEADRDRLTTVDLETRSVRSAEIRAPRTLIGWILDLLVGEAYAKAPTEGATKEAALSPDGARLFIVGDESRPARDANGEWEWNSRFLGLQVVEVATGRRLAGRKTRMTWISSVVEAGRLYLDDRSGRDRRTEVIDATTLERLARISGWEIEPTTHPDGRPIVLAKEWDYERDRTRLAILDPRTYRPRRSWTVNGYASWVVPAER